MEAATAQAWLKPKEHQIKKPFVDSYAFWLVPPPPPPLPIILGSFFNILWPKVHVCFELEVKLNFGTF